MTAAEYAALENAEQKLTGTFVDELAQGANLTLTVNQDRPGLRLKEMHLNGTNVISLFLDLSVVDFLPENTSVRLYPMGVEWRDPRASDATVYTSYRAFAQIVPGHLRADIGGGHGLFDHCTAWQIVGFYAQGGVAADELVFGMLHRELKSVSYPVTDNTFLEGRVGAGSM
jgi:hypothetical protein